MLKKNIQQFKKMKPSPTRSGLIADRDAQDCAPIRHKTPRAGGQAESGRPLVGEAPCGTGVEPWKIPLAQGDGCP